MATFLVSEREKRLLIDRSPDDSAEKINRGRRSYNSCGMKFAKQQDSEWLHRAELEPAWSYMRTARPSNGEHRCTRTHRAISASTPRITLRYSLVEIASGKHGNMVYLSSKRKNFKKCFTNYDTLAFWAESRPTETYADDHFIKTITFQLSSLDHHRICIMRK